jgi:hypothetical protein
VGSSYIGVIDMSMMELERILHRKASSSPKERRERKAPLVHLHAYIALLCTDDRSASFQG